MLGPDKTPNMDGTTRSVSNRRAVNESARPPKRRVTGLESGRGGNVHDATNDGRILLAAFEHVIEEQMSDRHHGGHIHGHHFLHAGATAEKPETRRGSIRESTQTKRRRFYNALPTCC